MAEEEEVLAEVEAVQAVYGHDCHVVRASPPHLRVHLKPRTADDSSKQFVEAVMEIRAGSEYPNRVPQIEIVEAKGLDEKRQAHLLKSVHLRAQELSFCLMLVAVCEEAVEILSNMNHPDGDCPLCLHPLFPDNGQNYLLPFMKLMSCFHCFHSECILKWWRWTQEQSETSTKNSVEALVPTSADAESRTGLEIEKKSATCPVCRKLFQAGDMEDVLDLLQNGALQLNSRETEVDEDAKEMLQSETEVKRREKFEAVLKLQEEKSGLIEPQKNNVLLPGMFLPETTNPPMTMAGAFIEQQDRSSTSNDITEETGRADPSNNRAAPSNRPESSKHKNSNTRRKQSNHHLRKRSNKQSSKQQWIKKECEPQ